MPGRRAIEHLLSTDPTIAGVATVLDYVNERDCPGSLPGGVVAYHAIRREFIRICGSWAMAWMTFHEEDKETILVEARGLLAMDIRTKGRVERWIVGGVFSLVGSSRHGYTEKGKGRKMD